MVLATNSRREQVPARAGPGTISPPAFSSSFIAHRTSQRDSPSKTCVSFDELPVAVNTRAMMNGGLTLSTDRFEASTPASHFINPHCFGKDFAKWMQAELKKWLVSASDPIQKDFGWVLLVPHQEHVFTLTIAMVDESIGTVSDEWWIDVSFEKLLNGFRAWFRKPPEAELGGLATIVETILASEPRFQKFASVG